MIWDGPSEAVAGRPSESRGWAASDEPIQTETTDSDGLTRTDSGGLTFSYYLLHLFPFYRA